jgi:hypothetical protein
MLDIEERFKRGKASQARTRKPQEDHLGSLIERNKWLRTCGTKFHKTRTLPKSVS